MHYMIERNRSLWGEDIGCECRERLERGHIWMVSRSWNVDISGWYPARRIYYPLSLTDAHFGERNRSLWGEKFLKKPLFQNDLSSLDFLDTVRLLHTHK
jgi:hypothetical protein